MSLGPRSQPRGCPMPPLHPALLAFPFLVAVAARLGA
jgi:hypothetical protein